MVKSGKPSTKIGRNALTGQFIVISKRAKKKAAKKKAAKKKAAKK